MAKKWTQLCPTVAFGQIKDEQVIGPIFEVLKHLSVVPFVTLDVGCFIAFWATGVFAIDPAPHRRLGLSKVFYLAAYPGLRRPARQDELTARELLIEFLIKDRPRVVFERVVVFD